MSRTYVVSTATRTADDLVTCAEVGRFASVDRAYAAAKRAAGKGATFDAAGRRYIGATATAYIA